MSDKYRLLKPIVWGAAGAAGLFLSYKAVSAIIKSVKANNAEKDMGDLSTQAAMALHGAFNPSGMRWMIDMDGTSTDAVFESLQKAPDIAKVLKAYKNLYGEALIERLEKELNSEELARAVAIIQSGGKGDNGKGGNEDKALPAKGQIPLAVKDARLYTDPKNYPGQKLVGTMRKGWALPYKWNTGRSKQCKALTEFLPAICYEVLSRTKEGREITVFVEAAAVKLLTTDEYTKLAPPSYLIKNDDL